ncbi:MAG: hypothetical protein R3A48_01465 [Polyangiales bacterium]
MGMILRAAASLALLASCSTSPPANSDAGSADVVAPQDLAPDVVTPDVVTPDVVTPDVVTPDVVTPDAVTPDVVTPDAVTPDAVTSDAAVDAPAADAAVDVLINGCPSLVDPLDAPGDAGAPDGGADDGGVDGGVDRWSNYAEPFFAQWCTRCHSVSLTDPSARTGAPPGFDWDVEMSVRMRLAQIRRQVGVVNAMPFNGPQPTCEERRRLVLWIDRGAL